MDRWIGGFLQVGAAFMCVAAGAVGDDGMLLLLPAAASGLSGVLLLRRDARTRTLPPEPSAPRQARLERVEEQLLSLQEDLARLREDRDFFRDLVVAGPERPSALRDRG